MEGIQLNSTEDMRKALHLLPIAKLRRMGKEKRVRNYGRVSKAGLIEALLVAIDSGAEADALKYESELIRRSYREVQNH